MPAILLAQQAVGDKKSTLEEKYFSTLTVWKILISMLGGKKCWSDNLKKIILGVCDGCKGANHLCDGDVAED